MLQVVLQAVSALAVTGGLVYAALQFRGWRTAQHVANFTTLVELQLQLRGRDLQRLRPCAARPRPNVLTPTVELRIWRQHVGTGTGNLHEEL
jgi:hypothetical protein